MKNQMLDNVTVTAPNSLASDLAGLNLFNDFDLQILQLQSEIEFMISERKRRAKFFDLQFEAQLNEFTTRWYDEIAEVSSMELKSLKHDIRVYGSGYEGTTYSVCKNKSTIAFKYLMETYEFYLERSDEFEDIDIQDFVIRSYRIDKDELMKITIVFNELESIIPYLVKWNREMEALQSDLELKVLHINFELGDIDKNIKALRIKIQDLRSASFLAGNIIEFKNSGARRLYYNCRKFEFVEQVRLVDISASGKTCSFEAIVLEKRFISTAYYPEFKTGHLRTFHKIRVASVLSNFYESK